MNGVWAGVSEATGLGRGGGRGAGEEAGRGGEGVLRGRGGRRRLGRLGQAEDLADAVLWLASDRADYVVGDVVRVSGGGNLE